MAGFLVSEVAHAGIDQGDAVLVGGGDDFFVAHRSAGLDHRLCAGLRQDVEAVAERLREEMGIRRG